jgi:hypothetical protein
MKKLRSRPGLLAGILLLSLSLFTSCSKSDDPPASPTGGVFVWTTGGVTYTADNNNAFISGPFAIVANKDAALASIKSFNITLTTFAAGTYTLSSAGSNQLGYFSSGGLVMSQSGTLNITANTGKLSGNFSTTLTGGATMTGDFTNVAIQP